jgi:hypothetical protein
VQLARIEGLEGHAQAAECRLTKKPAGADVAESSPTKRAKK